MKQTVSNGLLIAIEGIDGSGKSTLAQNLATLLQENNYDVLLTKEPGGSALGKQLRTILQTQTVPITPLAEYLLFAADRAQHFKDVIIPNLQQGKIIISDRMADSSLVYQGYGRGLDKEKINAVNAWVMQGIEPQVKFYVRILPEVALQRIQQRNTALTAFEKEKETFVAQLMEGFDNLFYEQQKTNPYVYTLEGHYRPLDLAQQAYEKVEKWIHQHSL